MPRRVSRPLRFLITAGPTREYIDPVRFISNDSSGRMGFALAAAATQRGHSATLVQGPVALPAPRGVRCVAVISAREMLAACRRAWPDHDVLLMAAAVADYAPVRRSRFKIKQSRRQPVLRLRPNPDVLAALSRRRRAAQVVVGFALEDRHGRTNALEKLERKRLDAIVLNRPAVIGAEHTSVELLVRGEGWRGLPQADKRTVAAALVRCCERLAAARQAAARQAADRPAPTRRPT